MAENAEVHRAGTGKKRRTDVRTGEHRSGKKKHTSHNSRKSKKRQQRGGFLGLFPQQGDSPFEVIRKCIFLMSSTVFIVCLCLIGQYFWDNYQNKIMNTEVREIYKSASETPTDAMPDPDLYEHYFMLSGAEALYAINRDVVGYIKIPDTEIDYPVLQYSAEKYPNAGDIGNLYYLDKNMYRQPEKAGSIFMDFRDHFDYVVDDMRLYDNSENLIIYGHNMHDYSMFGSLKKYINEADYYDQHPIINLNSNYRQYKYKIFGMIIVDVDDTTETQFDYWNIIDFEDETAFYDYVNEVKRRTVRLTDVDVTYGDQILTLSTCNSTFSEGRLVVFARLLREGEDLMEGCTSVPNPNIKWPNSYYRWHKNSYDPNAEFVPYG